MRNEPLLGDALLHEGANLRGDDVAHFFEGEVTGVEQVEIHVLQVALVGLGTLGREDEVILAPDDQRWGLVGAEVLLKRGVAVKVELIVLEQLQLDRVVVLAVQAELIELPGLGRDSVQDRKSTRLNSSHSRASRMPSSA